ncbi:MAG: hypothetical protein LC102_09695 [Ignavibacteriales bacterium]|nr:MAG: hypothetical protein F9K26_01325 [Ignavibacteriaceae bacterium]MBW7872051.1 hypothetical protein [Ignavibacteria bacterium]MCZ2143686.1 hypothetical protein [Ignavibacteriales bacterium]OQY79720.1 MAG: hypothetical protein B6D45_00395 [Ignavibacteriales bacterium UTCHB3]MBZ0195721.1 hypothetical protein [Ignavibacteriaceae bacterium]
MKKHFGENSAYAEEFWDWCTHNNRSANFVTKALINNSYRYIKEIVAILPLNAKLPEVGCGAAESSEKYLLC